MSITLSILLVQGFYSCSSDDKSRIEFTKNTTNSNQNSYLNKTGVNNLNGEEIFRGIFFLEGNLPQQVKFLNKRIETANEINMDEDASLIKSQIINEIVGGINDVSPSYFEDLEESYNKKDYYALKENIKVGADLLYVGLFNSNKMQEIAPEFKLLFENLDMDSYDFQDKNELNRFLSDINDFSENNNEVSAIFVAAVVAVVAVIAAVTVAVGVSWVGAVQVGGYFLAWVKTVGPIQEISGVLNDFDSELLTRDLIDALE